MTKRAPAQLDLFDLPVHAPPRPGPDRDEQPPIDDGRPFDDIAEAWEDLTGEPYDPDRARALALFDRARRTGRLVEP